MPSCVWVGVLAAAGPLRGHFLHIAIAIIANFGYISVVSIARHFGSGPSVRSRPSDWAMIREFTS